MSPGATPPPDRTPPAAGRNEPRAAPGGLKSALKVVVPIAALVGVIFGVTLLSMYTPKPAQDETKGEGGDAAAPRGEPPLRFFTSTRAWDPPSVAPEFRHLPLIAPSRDPAKAESPYAFSVQDRVFPGFYEPGASTPRRAAFWFENRNPRPVAVQLQGVSCSACSGGRVAAVPPEVARRHLQRTALAALPVGTFHAFGVGLADPAAEYDRLEWTTHKFSDAPHAAYQVPAAPQPPDKWAPQWGILELTFTVSKDPKIPLTAGFATRVEGAEQTGSHMFAIFYSPAEAVAVSRPVIDVGEINPLTGERQYQFLVYSATRGPGSEFGEFYAPRCEVQATPGVDPGPFLAVTKVEPVPDDELFEVAAETAKGGKVTKVRAAYRVTVALRPQVGDARLDLGALDRTINVAVGTLTVGVKVTGLVRGAVWLASGQTEVQLPTFKSRLGLVHTPELVTESAGTELTVVADQCKPRFIKYELVRKPDRGGQGYYDLRVTVPPARQYGAIDRDAVIVLEAAPAKPHPAVEAAMGAAAGAVGAPLTPPPPQRIRLPVRGAGEQG